MRFMSSVETKHEKWSQELLSSNDKTDTESQWQRRHLGNNLLGMYVEKKHIFQLS